MIRESLKTRSFFWRKTFYLFIVLILTVLSGLLVYSNWKIFQRLRASINFRQTAEINLKDETNREAELSAKVAKLQTESGLEKEIRERFPVAKPGEEVIMIISDNNEATSVTASQQKMSWWQKLFNRFGL